MVCSRFIKLAKKKKEKSFSHSINHYVDVSDKVKSSDKHFDKCK